MSSSLYHIFINATATQPGGGYTILMQFLKAYSEQPLPDTDVYVFNSLHIENGLSPFIIPVNMQRFNGRQRIYWDWRGMKRWAAEHNIKPDLILSFQNTGVRFDKVSQLIYLQQSIPFADHQWNFLNKAERQLWFYKNVYPFFIRANLFKHTYVVVQTKWMKQAFLKKFPRHNPEKVYVFSPLINEVNTEAIEKTFEEESQPHRFAFFYPANPLLYKNHIEIIKAFAAIRKENKQWDAQCYFTISINDLSEEARDIIKTNDLYSNFVFLGALSLQEVYDYYKAAGALIFPSYIETIGLPLIESAAFGLPILVADEPYSREVLASYNNVLYAKTRNTDDWKSKILEIRKFKKVCPEKIALSAQGWPDMIRFIGTLIKKNKLNVS